jgi:D-tyrosyl-tRNA(Tyr) deacylase
VRAVVQRVRQAEVSVAGERVARMGPGLLALVGVAHDDGERDADDLARRMVGLRIFEDDAGRMNRSLADAGGALGVVSQFTLMGDARQGRRPSFVAAARPEQAEPLVARVVEAARGLGVPVVTGRFGAQMEVALVNAGPVTLLLDTRKAF